MNLVLRYNLTTSFCYYFILKLENNVMKTSTPQTWKPLDILLSFSIFTLVLAGVYALLVAAPYAGFYFNSSNGEVVDLYQNPDNGLQMGDVIKQIGEVSWDDYKQNKYLTFFKDAHPGQVYEILVERKGEEILLKWPVSGFNEREFSGRFFSTWWLSFLFWFFGFVTHRYIHPRDLAWRLLVALNYLMALFIAFGNVSAFHVLGSPVWMKMAVWLMTPVFLQLHWIFPIPLRSLPRWVWSALYLFCGVLAALEIFPFPSILPYFLGLLLAFTGGLVLLIIHYIQQPSGRSDIRLLAIALLAALLPIITVSLVGISGWLPAAAPLSLFALAFLPGSYVYAINRRRMGNMELRASRAISSMSYLFLLMSLLPFVTLLIAKVNLNSQELEAASALLFSLFIAALTIYLFPHYQTMVEQRVLGITLPHKKILETYSTRITSSTTQADLVSLLEKDIFNSLQVQQYAFLAKEGVDYVTLLTKNVTADQVKTEEAFVLLAEDHEYRLIPPSTSSNSQDWIRMILPLSVETGLVGVWLLGQRDPDDLYPQADLPIIRSLASQTAIALSNIQKTAQLKFMYQANVDRYEQERLGLALELHDSVLNELAALLMTLDPSAQTLRFQTAYASLAHRLREIVTELRPPLLDYGLQPGLGGLADSLSERHQDTVQIEVTIQNEEELHYPQSVERHIYRMAQEACENAIRHGHARSICISGSLGEDCIDLTIEDDGSGFNAEGADQLDRLVSQKHFGLAGMQERAMLIGAEVRFHSIPQKGTRVTIHWKANA